METSWGWWFETLSLPLWRHRYDMHILNQHHGLKACNNYAISLGRIGHTLEIFVQTGHLGLIWVIWDYSMGKSYFHGFICDAITHPCASFDGDLTELKGKLLLDHG